MGKKIKKEQENDLWFSYIEPDRKYEEKIPKQFSPEEKEKLFERVHELVEKMLSPD
jgi:hypothetical protein